MNPQQAAMQDVLHKVDTAVICLKTAITSYGLSEEISRDLELTWLDYILQVKGYSQSSLSAELQASLSPSSRGQYLHTIYTLSNVSTQYLHYIYTIFTQ